jgi:hypothetical protein
MSIQSGDLFKTIRNNGCLTENNITYTNQCMWISVLDYLKHFLNRKITLGELRYIGMLDDTTRYSMFDINNGTFVRSIDAIANNFNLHIQIYYVNANGYCRWLGNHQFDFGNFTSTNIVNIAAFGNHFELIVDNVNFNDNNVNKKIRNFIPEIDIASGNKINDNVTEYFIAIVRLQQEIDICKKYSISEQIKAIEQIIKNLEIKLKEIQSNIETYTYCAEYGDINMKIIYYEIKKSYINDETKVKEHLNLQTDNLNNYRSMESESIYSKEKLVEMLKKEIETL